MCRIAGIIDLSNTIDLSHSIGKMTDAMKNGGPDDEGQYIDTGARIALGHRRLSLIDLSSAGHQPMWDEEKKITIIFNGEIYNFEEIKCELQKAGFKFRTGTDTEVIIDSYKYWGKDCFEKFNGMFALAIYDLNTNELILARDHAGIKPLYYFIDDNKLLFASEIRAFKQVNVKWETTPEWKGLFLLFGHIPEPFTTLKNVVTLSKGTYLCFNTKTLTYKHYKFYKPQVRVQIHTEEDAIQAIKQSLTKAVNRHLISDAPIGLFLSGGIDSSILTILASPVLKDQLHTLSIQFSEAKFSEAEYQNVIIQLTKANHARFKVSQKDFEESYDDILRAMDQPSIDGINTYFISMYAKQFGLKAVLSGIGGDELFGGYPSFQRYNTWKHLRTLPNFTSKVLKHNTHPKFSRLSFLHLPELISLYLLNRGLFTIKQAAHLSDIDESALLNACSKIEVGESSFKRDISDNAVIETDLYMKNQLLKDADYMSMWHGIEIRVPFLDKDFIDCINSIDISLRYKNDIAKALLVKSFFTVLPAEIWARKKQGFTFPFDIWLKNSAEFKPATKNETQVFSSFAKGKLHWSRYWAMKVASQEVFA